MEEFKKLSDDILENVSGGTNSEMIDLQKRLNAKNIKEIITGLKNHGISAELSSLEKNSYVDMRTNQPLSHEEVLAMLKMK